MPLLIGSSSPPSIRSAGEKDPLLVIGRDAAHRQDIRPLRIGLVNSMPDAAFYATERQFMALIGSESVLQIDPVFMTCGDVSSRSEGTKAHIREHYTPVSQIQSEGVDALIMTGANFGNDDIRNLPMWKEFVEIFEWSQQHVVSTLTSCLATHAYMEHRYSVKRILQKNKIWGVFPHTVIDKRHPLVQRLNTRFDVPHSRWNNIPRESFEKAGLEVLAAGEEAGVHLVASPDFRWIGMQGHPEYDTISLWKEYVRDQRTGLSHVPNGYLPDILAVPGALELNSEVVEAQLSNTWNDTAQVIFSRWIALVYRLVHPEKRGQYASGIDPINPLASIK